MYYRHYKNGFLPCGGGLSNQPSKFMEIVGLVDSIRQEVEARRDEAGKPPSAERQKGNPFADQM